jgi:hypothetical protein
MKKISFSIYLIATFCYAWSQNESTYLKTNAIRIEEPEMLNSIVYDLLSPYQAIMFGEMHGTNESAPFVSGLVRLMTAKGDSVLVGLEIPPEQMSEFLNHHTDSTIRHSTFFTRPNPDSGRESVPWLNLLLTLNKNPKVKIFFFDVNADEGRLYDRDSVMATKIRMRHSEHPTSKVITLSGNYHNMITNPFSMISVFKRNSTSRVCSLNMLYKEGSANANFGRGLEVKELGSYPSVYNSTDGYDRYVMLLPSTAYADYDGFYYVKAITPAKMVLSK